ncbi:MAG: HAD hydrolase family protein [Bacteroidales bacterium]|nr:HAD hydrolase family protein [Bacteroidales bacterium]MBO5854081.1 HAD hydrolase family protein [Bacteroidales bacterium]
MKNYKEQLKDITTFIFDYDGVMTNGDVLVDADGVPLRSTNVKDGFALQLAARLGYNIAIITGGYSVSIEKRMEMLGIKDVFVRSASKVEVLQKYMETKNLKPEEIIYMGDDLPDYPVMKMVGLPVCPADAVPEIKDISLYISHLGGGKGAVRDIIEQVLKAQDKWMKDFTFYVW